MCEGFQAPFVSRSDVEACYMFKKLVSEPLFHFAVAGAVIFLAYFLTDDAPAEVAESQIVVSLADARRLAEQYEATWRRPPSGPELDALIDEYIKEEMLVREALALGLDQNDTIVRRRLRQKMEFLIEASATSATPEDQVLIAFYDDNSDMFAKPARLSFDQIMIDNGAAAASDALAQLTAGVDPASIGVRTLLPSTVPPSTAGSIDGTFGQDFAAQLEQLDVGTWQGPVSSGFGQHLVRVTRIEPADVPPFPDVRDRVETEWRASEAVRQRTLFLERLGEGYEITRPDPTEVLN